MEVLAAFDVTFPAGVPAAEVQERVSAEATAAAGLVGDGRLVRLWRPPPENLAIGLYRADSEAELDRLVAALPLAGASSSDPPKGLAHALRHRAGPHVPRLRAAGSRERPAAAE